MNKIIYNSCYGGFGLSNKAVIEICRRKNIPIFFYKEKDEDILINWDDRTLVRITEEEALSSSDSIHKCSVDCGEFFTRKDPIYETFNKNYIWYPINSRHDPILIQVVEELGPFANGECADLKIFKTESTLYRIDEYDGMEHVITPEMDLESYIKIEQFEES